MAELRKYGTLLADGVAGSAPISLSLRVAGTGTFATASEWTPAAGDVRLSKDGGALANVTNLPTYANGQWKFVLTAAELSAKVVFVLIIDAVIDSESFVVETFGNASAMWPDNWSALLLGTPAGASLAADVAAIPAASAALPGSLTSAERNAVADALFARALPASPTPDTAGEALVGARVQAFGKWAIAGDTLTLYASNGTTVVKTFALTPPGGPYTARA